MLCWTKVCKLKHVNRCKGITNNGTGVLKRNNVVVLWPAHCLVLVAGVIKALEMFFWNTDWMEYWYYQIVKCWLVLACYSCLKLDHHYWLFLSEHFWWEVNHDFFYFPDSLKHLRCSGTTKTILSSVDGLRNRGTDLESEEEKNIANSHLDSIMQLPNDIKMQCIGSVKYCI